MKQAKCLDCGLSYEEFGVDITFSDEDWAVIHPDKNGLLCATCICKRVYKINGAVAIRATIDKNKNNNETGNG